MQRGECLLHVVSVTNAVRLRLEALGINTNSIVNFVLTRKKKLAL